MRGFRVDRTGTALRTGGPFDPDDPRARGVRYGARAIWLVFVLIPLVQAVASKESTAGRVLVVVAALAFIADYLALVIGWARWRAVAQSRLLLAGLILISILLTVLDDPGWGYLFVYCAAAGAMFNEPRPGFVVVLICAVLGGALPPLAGNGGDGISFATSSAGIGLLMLLMRDLRVRNDELNEARAELAQMAVARERERFARDLHDLLGHTLSVIAIKAELAGRLLPDRVPEAASEVADLERVAREALSEVREAVSGYRRPTLEDELAGAQMALTAAGIESTVDRAPLDLDPEREAVLAWAVREGATNVIRHSSARHCTIAVRMAESGAVVEIVDDGKPAGADRDDGGGNGLAGLAERARAVGGSLRAGARDGAAGFGLTVAVPAS